MTAVSTGRLSSGSGPSQTLPKSAPGPDGGPHDLDEFGRIEAGPADQEAVHVGARHQLFGIARLDGPPVLDPHLDSLLLPHLGRHHPTDPRTGVLGVLRGGRLTGPDSPD